MKDNYILTAESVTEGHPDKLCDTIADRVLDACLMQDLDSRVACEVMATAGKIIVAGEITTKELPDIPHIVCKTVREVGYHSDYEVEVLLHDQSEDIANAVNGFGDLASGDRGVVYGYACKETPMLLPLPVVLAHRITRCITIARKEKLLPWLKPDGKAQVSVEYENGVPKRIHTVVVSVQHDENMDEDTLWDDVYNYILVPAIGKYMDRAAEVLINPGGLFVKGGFEADTGLTGRKLMVDTYGGLIPHGGGALSGKDGTKVDRSGSYMARFLAKNIVAAGLAASAAKNLAMLTLALGKNHKKLSGKTNLRKMLKDTREIQTISLPPEQYKLFQKRAAKYKILYATIKDKQDTGQNIDILMPVTELSRANLLMERIGLGESQKPSKKQEEHAKNGSRWEPGWSDTRNNPTCSKQKDGIQRANDQKPSIEAKLEGHRQSSSRGGNKTRKKQRGTKTKAHEK